MSNYRGYLGKVKRKGEKQMREKKNIVQTQVRLPENIYTEVKQEAEELGVSLNAHLIELLWLGIKARNSFPIIPNVEHQQNHD